MSWASPDGKWRETFWIRIAGGRGHLGAGGIIPTRYVSGMGLLTVLLLACAPGTPETPPSPAITADPPPVALEAVASAPAASATSAARPRVVFLGDSITAGMGLGVEDAFPAQLSRIWEAAGLPAEVVNAGVSGDTTAGGLRRLDWILGQKPDVVVLALGANDMLRGLPPEEAEANLRQMVTRSQAAGAAVVLVGMRANPTLGPDYVAKFDVLYPRLAAELEVPLVPFMLDGVAGVTALNQADGIHPTAEGQAKVAGLVGAAVEPVLRARLARRAVAPPG